MNWTTSRGAVILMAAGLCAPFQALAGAPHIDDPAGVIAKARAQALETKLDGFERKTGIRIVMQFHPKEPSKEEDSVAGAYMSALSAELALIDNGVLAVHFADDDDWRVWIGNDLAARFVGKAGTAREHTASGAMHEAKEAWFEQVLAKADHAWKAAATGTPKPEDKLPFAAEAIADGLIAKLTPGGP